MLVATSASYALAQAPNGSDAHAPAAVQKQGDDTRGTPAPGASSQAATQGAGKNMKSKPTGLNGAKPGTTRGEGTTGTGGKGGSGNE